MAKYIEEGEQIRGLIISIPKKRQGISINIIKTINQSPNELTLNKNYIILKSMISEEYLNILSKYEWTETTEKIITITPTINQINPRDNYYYHTIIKASLNINEWEEIPTTFTAQQFLKTIQEKQGTKIYSIQTKLTQNTINQSMKRSREEKYTREKQIQQNSME